MEQGWCSGESTRLPPTWPGFDSRSRCNMWVEFVVGSRPCSERFFSEYSGFPLSSKTNISKFQFDLESVPNRSFDYNYQNPSVFGFLMLIRAIVLCSPLGLQNLNFKRKTK